MHVVSMGFLSVKINQERMKIQILLFVRYFGAYHVNTAAFSYMRIEFDLQVCPAILIKIMLLLQHRN